MWSAYDLASGSASVPEPPNIQRDRAGVALHMRDRTMRSTIATTLLAACMSGLTVVSASAQSIERAYTSFDSKKCKPTKGTEPEDYGNWLCPGYGNIPVRLAAGDQRMYVTFGKSKKNDGDDLAASQTFPAFNDVYSGTVEWR